MIHEKENQIQLMNQTLSPSQAFEQMAAMVDGLIKQINLQNLRAFEQPNQLKSNADTEAYIDHLKQQKQELHERFMLAEQLGCHIEATVSFNIKLTR
ncbi:hypothetical protein [Roseivirga sp. UBA1976]|uniref:hypothetical protein n=1 Tax=Roseivirga sp. UBA1976 TaxID=1947386 RepID=UPI00257C551D|nr:hypothetical protein [Roseivirga sp. UBA1976]|tara:strand:+ start:206 stop:496 length:291 start_codon:yes stop_codon:yes gene_type:complete